MLHHMYSIYDAKACAFNVPFFFANDALAIRAAQTTIADKNTQFARYPDDFVLYKVGVFDDQTGESTGYSPAVHVVAFAQLLENQPLPPEPAEAVASIVP